MNAFPLWTQNPEVIKEIMDKFEYIEIKNTINKVRKTTNKTEGETATARYYTGIIINLFLYTGTLRNQKVKNPQPNKKQANDIN